MNNESKRKIKLKKIDSLDFLFIGAGYLNQTFFCAGINCMFLSKIKVISGIVNRLEKLRLGRCGVELAKSNDVFHAQYHILK